jgi:hypothetical protein
MLFSSHATFRHLCLLPGRLVFGSNDRVRHTAGVHQWQHPASDTLFAPMMLDVSSEELLCAVLEFDPVEMTIGVANVFARVCNSVAPLNVTLLRTVSGS